MKVAEIIATRGPFLSIGLSLIKINTGMDK